MRRSVIKRAVFLIVALTMLMITATACFGDDAKVNVTVDGGSGGGKYTEGQECTVTAQAPEGYKFVEWTVFGMKVSDSNPYKFTVDFDIEIKAEFEKIPKTKYTVTVSGGTIGTTGLSSAELDVGTVIDIFASESQARDFVKWTVDGVDSTANPYRLTVAKNTVITASFNEFCMVSVSGGTVDGQRSKIVAQGSEVTVTAGTAPEGQMFRHWYVLDDNFNEVIKSEDTAYTFTLSDSLKVYAKFTYCFTVSVTSGAIVDSEEASITVFEGTQVAVTPATAPEGKAFIGWYSGEEKVSISKTFAFSVTENIELTAKYGTLTTQTLATPTSSGNGTYPTSGLIYREGGGAVAFDRVTNTPALGATMFVEGSDHILYKIYTSTSANTATDSIGELILKLNPTPAADKTDTAFLSSSDGKMSMPIRGQKGDLYFDNAVYGTFQNILKHELGYDYSASQQYYFAAQVKASVDPTITMEGDTALQYLDSGISSISTQAFRENGSAPAGKFTITVLGDGTIGESLKTVEAGYGANVTINTQMPDDDTIEWVFVGWKEVTALGPPEVLGSTLSKSLSFTFGVTKAITIRPVFKDKNDITVEELPMPDNSANKLIFEEGNSSQPIALDRAVTGSMFSTNVDYVIFYIYNSTSADRITGYVGRIKMKVDLNKDADGGRAIVGSFSLLDDTLKKDIIRGNANNYYHQNRGDFASLVVAALGTNYNSSSNYYFAAQAVAAADSGYADSEISVIGTNGIKF